MTKTYFCPTHGHFDHECTMKDEELKECEMNNCEEKITRVWKTVNYTDCDGFYGRGR